MARSDWLRGRNPVEFASWRAAAFRRFQIGVRPSGREEWLEFWKGNHLLPPFEDIYARREAGPYGGRSCDFLALPDLIRSNETEREKDWIDIQYLEEFHDARLAAAARAGGVPLASARAQLRSRRGLETHPRAGTVHELAAVGEALAAAANPVTVALLLLPAARGATRPAVAIEPAIEGRLRTALVGSPFHLTLVEAVRRRYKQDAMQADKADKADKQASASG